MEVERGRTGGGFTSQAKLLRFQTTLVSHNHLVDSLILVSVDHNYG